MIIQKTAENFAGFMGGDFLFWLLVIFAVTAFFTSSLRTARRHAERKHNAVLLQGAGVKLPPDKAVICSQLQKSEAFL